MRPSAQTQVRLGVATVAITLLVVAVLAFVPDPLMRQRAYVTTFDNVDAVSHGAPVYFRGAVVGDIRAVRLDPDRGLFDVRMGVRRDWRPGSCAFARIVAPLPVTAPRVELVSLDDPACAAARLAAGCEVLEPPKEGAVPLPGCRREGDMLHAAAEALAQVTELTRTANRMAAQLQTVMDGSGRPGEAAAVRRLMADAQATLATANQMTARLNHSLAPGRGDAAVAMTNLRTISGKATKIDIDGLNAAIADARALVGRNEANVDALLSQGAGLSVESRALLRDVSGTLVSASANLERTSGNIDALTERLGDDPTFAVRGQDYADPPPPGGP